MNPLELAVFNKYGICQRTAAALLSRIYPFEKFLWDVNCILF